MLINYEYFAETIPDAVLLVDKKGNILIANNIASHLFQYNKQELQNSNVEMLVPDNVREIHWKHIKDYFSSPSRRPMGSRGMLYGKRKDGTLFNVDIMLTPATVNDTEYTVCVIRDTTSEIETQKELEKRLDQQKAIAQLGRYSIKNQDLHVFFEYSVEICRDVLSATCTQLLKIAPCGSHFKAVGLSGWNININEDLSIANTTYTHAGYTYDINEPIIFNNLDYEIRFKGADILYEHSIKSGISSLIYDENNSAWGTLSAFSTENNFFNEDDLGFIQSICNIIEETIKRHNSEEKLKHNEMLLDIASTCAKLGGWRVDLNNELVYWSDQVCHIHEMPTGTILSIDEGIDFYAQEYRDHIKKRFDDCVENAIPFDEELQIITKSGTKKWVRSIGVPRYDNDQNIYDVVGAFQDIDDYKNTEIKLRYSEERLREAQSVAKIGHWEFDIPSNQLYWSDEIYDIFGVSKNDIEPSYDLFLSFAHPDDKYFIDTAYKYSVENKQPYTIDHRIIRPDGSIKYIHEQGRTYYDNNDNPLRSIGTAQDITERKSIEQRLHDLAYIDQLTSLYTKHGFQQHASRLLKQDVATIYSYKLVVIDVCNISTINHVYGFDVGDDLLKKISELLSNMIGPDDLIGRVGGDLFACLINAHAKHIYTPFKFIRWINNTLNGTITIHSNKIALDIRIGLLDTINPAAPTAEQLRNAELALNKTREQSTHNWSIYDSEYDHELSNRITITNDLRDALNLKQFQLHFQPKVKLNTGQLIGAEALLRWHHPERGLQSPGNFIPIAEQSQLIAPIGDWAIDEVCRCLRQWQHEGLDIVQVAVNVSLIQFKLGDFPETVRQALQTHGLSPSALSLEITESVFEYESPALLRQLRRLNEMGVRLSLDDFGTGYSSLLYLQQYPFDEIKIDRGFVANLVDDPYSRSIVTTVMGLAGALQAEVVAEGIESAAIRARLIELGCLLGQGFYYSLPLEAEDFRLLLEKQPTLPFVNDY